MKTETRLLNAFGCAFALALCAGPLRAFQPPNPDELKPDSAQKSASGTNDQPLAGEDPLEAAVGLLPYLSGDPDEQGKFSLDVAVAFAKRGDFDRAEEIAKSINVYQRGLTFARLADLRFQEGNREEGERLLAMAVEHGKTVTGGGRSYALAEAAVLMAREQAGDWKALLEEVPEPLDKLSAMARAIQWMPIEEVESQVNALLADDSPKGRAAHMTALLSAAKNNRSAGTTRTEEAIAYANRVFEHTVHVPSAQGELASREALGLLVKLDPERANEYRARMLELAVAAPTAGEWRPPGLVEVAREYLAAGDRESATKAVEDALAGCKGLDHFFWLDGYPAAVAGLFALGDIERAKSELVRVLKAGKNYPHPRAAAMAALRVLLLLEAENQRLDGAVASEMALVRNHLSTQIP